MTRAAWCTDLYLREETLRPAIAAVVGFQHRQPLSRHWGGGTLSSSDGQRFPVPVRSRIRLRPLRPSTNTSVQVKIVVFSPSLSDPHPGDGPDPWNWITSSGRVGMGRTTRVWG